MSQSCPRTVSKLSQNYPKVAKQQIEIVTQVYQNIVYVDGISINTNFNYNYNYNYDSVSHDEIEFESNSVITVLLL